MTAEKGAMQDEGSMPVSEHLRELRNRIIIVLAVLFVFVLISLRFTPAIVTALTDLGTRVGYEFVYLAPQELLMVYLSISVICGCVLALPVFAYHAYGFCSPGLTKKEKTYTRIALLSGTIFFCLGVLFARFVTMPFMLKFLIQFSGNTDISASISINQYVSFLLTVFLIFGTVFELPVVTVLLTALGIIKAEWLVKGRKVVIVLIFVLAALITPPDIASQIMVAIPVILLYQLSIILCRLVSRKKKASQQENEA
jgi:sec-independent protein translocase protein TatC